MEYESGIPPVGERIVVALTVVWGLAVLGLLIWLKIK